MLLTDTCLRVLSHSCNISNADNPKYQEFEGTQ